VKRRDRPAGNIQGLERWLTDWAAEQSMTAGRLRRRVGMIAIAAMIDDLNRPEPRFVFKGGAAFEFRFGEKARTSSDIDAIFRGNLDDAIVLLKAAIETGWSGFSGRLIDDGPFEVPGVPIPPRRATAKLTYKGKAFISVPIEVASPEGRSLDHIDVVEIRPLHELGLEGPSTVPVLAPPYQIAQKLHACTTVALDARPRRLNHARRAHRIFPRRDPCRMRRGVQPSQHARLATNIDGVAPLARDLGRNRFG
jgi:Nucleotidyl transferase AbiEii toxin, Type IV TA system